MKLDHIAVVLRGHVRTWHYIYPMVFDFYDSIAENVDYYFITWDSSNTDGVVETFKHQNLIHFQIVAKDICDGEYYDSLTGPGFMGTMILPHLKAKEEKLKNKTYDAIFDSRPDVIMERTKVIHGDNTGENLPVIVPEHNSVHITGLEVHINQHLLGTTNKSGLPDIAIQDWCLMFHSQSYRLILDRYLHKNQMPGHDKPGAQIEYRQILEEKNINICTSDWLVAKMARPTCFELDWDLQNDFHAICNTSTQWMEIDSEKRKELCLRYKVSLSDYMDTPSLTCKI
jgi:hypothetical protein